MLRIKHDDPFAIDLDEWPRDVELIISALHAAGRNTPERRSTLRRRYRVIARLNLFCNNAEPPTKLYVRDCTERNLGFLSATPVPLGYGGTVDVPGSRDTLLSIACVVHRCRECVPGWYEGVLHFNRAQADLRFPG